MFTPTEWNSVLFHKVKEFAVEVCLPCLQWYCMSFLNKEMDCTQVIMQGFIFKAKLDQGLNHFSILLYSSVDIKHDRDGTSTLGLPRTWNAWKGRLLRRFKISPPRPLWTMQLNVRGESFYVISLFQFCFLLLSLFIFLFFLFFKIKAGRSQAIFFSSCFQGPLCNLLESWIKTFKVCIHGNHGELENL